MKVHILNFSLGLKITNFGRVEQELWPRDISGQKWDFSEKFGEEERIRGEYERWKERITLPKEKHTKDGKVL